MLPLCGGPESSKISQAELFKLQRMTCLGITRAMRAAPTAAMEVLLGLPTLHLQVEPKAKIGNYRLRCNEQWKQRSKDFGQVYVTQDMEKKPVLQMGSDKIILNHVYDKPSRSDFLIEVSLRRGSNPIEKGTNLVYRWFQDKRKGTGAGMYFHLTKKKLSFSLGQYTTVFQA
jgi:hypothetical protein